MTGGGTAVLLLNHGAADSQRGVATFLQNIFRDRDIIRLPVGPAVQRRAAQMIGRRRAPRVAHLYGYMGGGSPLVPYMRAQAAQLEAALAADGKFSVHLGLRYFTPSIADALREIVAAGAERVVVFPQYPQYSTTTVGSCKFELERAIAEVPGADGPDYVNVAPFGADPRYVELVAARVRTATDALRGERAALPTLLFSAHSVPMKFVDDGDPYPDEINEQARLVAHAAGYDTWEVSYQSRSGPVRWLGPETVEHVGELLDNGATDFVVVPPSFVQDHLETLVELDVQLAAKIEARGGRYARVRAVNADPRFAALSADLVRDALAGVSSPAPPERAGAR